MKEIYKFKFLSVSFQRLIDSYFFTCPIQFSVKKLIEFNDNFSYF